MRYLAVALFVVGLGGCLAVDSPDGALTCSMVPQRACPQGFYCLASTNTCWRDGHFPADMAVPDAFFIPPAPDDLSFPGFDFSMIAPPDDLSQTD
ncbi:MAG TPA: hypothetical protein VHB97_06290 [Polyangia bacterium]|nr:hypothetical protein [Polyangia bacterium]